MHHDVDFGALGFGAEKKIHLIRMHERFDLRSLMGEMIWSAARRFITVATAESGDEHPPVTYRLQIIQMVAVLLGGTHIVIDGSYKMTQTQRFDVVGVKITGVVVARSEGIVEQPEPLRIPHDYVCYLERESDGSTGQLARHMWIEFLEPYPRDVHTNVASILGYTPKEQAARWHVMGIGDGDVHPVCPIGGLEPLELPALLEKAGLGYSSPQREQATLVLTTDNAIHRGPNERCTVEVRMTDFQVATPATNDLGVDGYLFVGEIIGLVMGSEVVKHVPPLDHPVNVRGFVEPTGEHRPAVVWFQIDGREPRTNGITEKPLAPQFQ